ncbi:MAG: hypothetical protein L6R41_001539 [Letrouitia leprolyta]|nr:MAG: hypothetical protein L6R41_001539 [Letrouitia leprolyta]
MASDIQTSSVAFPSSSDLRERQITSSASELSYHIIEAGDIGRPLLILLHGFPELAYSWRKIMPSLAQAGYYVVAFDQRGYGQTVGWDGRPYDEVDLRTFVQTNLVRDVVVLAKALGYHEVYGIVGHDFGCVPASLCALIRPDMFRRVVVMSLPFLGTPSLPFATSAEEEAEIAQKDSQPDIHVELAGLPQPKKHYRWYYSSSPADKEMSQTSGLKDFLRGYFHLKSADANSDPQPITATTAQELNKLPSYYVMPLHLGMRDTVSRAMTADETANMQSRCQRWLPDSDLQIYVDTFKRTGFQGGLNWYRVSTDPALQKDLDIYSGKKIEVPCLYISGVKDWLLHQIPNGVEKMKQACTRFCGPIMVEGAGHWVQQEQPGKVAEALLRFLED